MDEGRDPRFNGALIDNSGTFRANAEDANAYSASGAASQFRNTGTVVKASGTAITKIALAFDNQGEVKGQSGLLQFGGGGIPGQTAPGAWRATYGQIWWTAGSFSLGSDVQLSGGVGVSYGASVTAGSVQGATAALIVSGGSFALMSTSTASSVSQLIISSGSLSGVGTLNVVDSLSWSGGTMSGTGATVLGSAATGTINPPGSYGEVILDTRTLRNAGTLTWSLGAIRGFNGALVENSGTFRANSEYGTGAYSAVGAASQLRNTGSVVKTAGSATTKISMAFDNKGEVTAQTGILRFAGGGVPGQTATGSWLTTGGQVFWAAGSFSLGSGVQLSGALFVTGATVSAASVNGADAALQIQYGSFSVTDSTTSSSLRDLWIYYGATLSGAATLNVANSLSWAGGTMSGTGATVLGSSATATVNPATTDGAILDTRTLRNQGTMTLSAGSIRGFNGALIDNSGTLRVNSQDGSVVSAVGAASLVRNTGTVTKTSGSGVSQISMVFDNRGDVSAQTGELHFGGGGVAGQPAAGSWSAASGAQVRWMGGTFPLASHVQISGPVMIWGAAVTAASIDGASASLQLTGAGSFSINDASTPSTLRDLTIASGTLTGAATLKVSGSLVWNGGTMSGTGVTVLGSSSTASVSTPNYGEVILDTRTLRNQGTFTWTKGAIRGFNGALIDNSGTFRANAEDADAYSAIGAASRLISTGTIRKTTGTGITRIRLALGNAGTLGADTGTLQTLGPVIPVGSSIAGQAGGANPAVPNAVRSCAGKPVDCATGNQFEIQTDLAVGGRGLGLQATRTYNSQTAAIATVPGSYGYGWTASYADRLLISTVYGMAAVYHANGSTVVFSDYGSGNYQAAPWVQSTLTKNADGTYTYVLPTQVTFKFASDGRLLSQTDRNGNATTMSYTADRLTSVTDPAGRSLTYSYNSDATVASITDPTGLTVTYAYTGGNLTGASYTGVSSAQWTFGYDGSHQLTAMTDARGQATTTAYDASRRVTSQTDALDRTRTWSYGTNTTTITNPGGDVTHKVFENGQPIEITRAQGTPQQATQTLTYNANRALSSSTDASGRTTTYGYDAAGNRTSVTVPGGRTSTSTYNATRDVTSATTPSGKTTSMTYDPHGNLTSVTRTLTRPGQQDTEQTSTYGYDAAGNQTSATDPLQHTTTFEYDNRGNMTGRTDPLGHTTSWSYDDGSRVASITSPRGHVSGNDPEDFTTHVQRDARGRAIGSTDGTGRHASTTYDALRMRR